MTDQERELLREWVETYGGSTLPNGKLVNPELENRTRVALAQPKAAPQGRGRLTYDKATRTIRDERGTGVLVLTAEDADMFSSAAPDSGMPELSYGELMMLCEGHGTSKIYERFLALRAYALSLREQRENEEDARRYRWLRSHGPEVGLLPFIAQRSPTAVVVALTHEYADAAIDAALKSAPPASPAGRKE